MKNKKITFIDFFAGVGGFRRGLELVGFECVGFCEFDKFANAGYRSMHTITEEQREYILQLKKNERVNELQQDKYLNGEWYLNDITKGKGDSIPSADCWCFGAPCQDFSIAGHRKGLNGERSSLIGEIFRLLEERQEENRPEWLVYENVKGMFSSNRGLDYLSIISEMDRLGYDVEWQNINSKWFVPQNRERIYTIGHLRRRGRKQILPIGETDIKNKIKQQRGLNVLQMKNIGKYLTDTGKEHQRSKIFGTGDVIQTLNATDYKEPLRVALPIICEERKDEGLRFFKNNVCGTLRTIDSCGDKRVICQSKNEIHTVWNEKYQCEITVRKLTPKECFRLQGWSDDYFEKAEMVNSNTQLYKQAGNGVTVNVIEVIGKKILKGEIENDK